MTYDAGSSGALAYLEAAREVAERGALESADDRTTGSRPNGDTHQADHEYQAASPVLQEEQ